MRVLFILPGAGGGGGAHSVVQECAGLIRMGVEAAIAATSDTLEGFRWHYPELEGHPERVRAFDGVEALRALLPDFDLAIATTAESANLLAEARGPKPKGGAKPAYYIQDYEPLFFLPGTERWEQARASFKALGPNALYFAKTDWLRRIVHDNHGVEVQKVSPSIDHAVYHPSPREDGGPLRIAAMIRPRSPRRAPKRTMRILERIAASQGDKVRVTAFGCDAADYERTGMRLSGAITDLGVLRRSEVAAMLRETDLFLDLSDYQAFGRTGLEAMASGCTPLLPAFGGADEYVRAWENALVADTRSDEAVMAEVEAFIAAAPKVRQRLRDNGLSTALNYTVEKAAFSEYRVFRDFLEGA
ncbi:MAG: glycosyltransferase family 4 protein [Caulobacteraceae bacterium]